MAMTLGVAPEAINPETLRDECPKWDSLANLNLMLALEDAFGITLTVEQISDLRSVPAILAHLQAVLDDAEEA
jgi:acyl carrier protein